MIHAPLRSGSKKKVKHTIHTNIFESKWEYRDKEEKTFLFKILLYIKKLNERENQF